MKVTQERHVSSNELHVRKSVAYIRERMGDRPSIAIVLGSGLGDFASQLKRKTIIPVGIIPHYPTPTVQGHSGRLILGKLGSSVVLAFQGRTHYYETGDVSKLLHTIRVAAGLGVRLLLVTNAAGGINRQFRSGDFMLITDQINLTFERPLARLRPVGKVKKPLYDSSVQEIIARVAAEHEIPIRRGVYCGMKGPSYETAAEVEMIRRIGGDAVGMSTVNEVSLAVRLGMRVGGISCITNLATGVTTARLSHGEVTEVANRVKDRFSALIRGVVQQL